MSAPPPAFIPPMLAVHGRPFDSEEHLFEPKWDGLRCLWRYDGDVTLLTRSGRPVTDRFPELCGVRPLSASAYLLDGELICLDEAGKPAFDRVRDRLLLQRPGAIARAAERRPAVYVVFDLLHCDGASLLDLPLIERRARLERSFVPSPPVRLSPVTPHRGTALFAAACAQGLEGIIAKERLSPYLPGRRSRAWIKVRRTRTGTFWIVGYTLRGPHLRSVAVADGAVPVYAGHVGSGLDEETKVRVLSALRALPPADPRGYRVPAAASRNTAWVRPVYRCRVEYLEWTPGGSLRHPVFRGLVASDGRAATGEDSP